MSGSRHPNNLKSAGSLQEFLLVHHALGITRHVVVQPFCVLGRDPYTAVRDPFSESGIKDFLSVHLYPSFNEHFNPNTSTVLADYCSLLNDSGKPTFMPLTYEDLFEAMKKCGMDEIDGGWIPYLTRRYIL